ncbi:hypothetical protein ES703_54249 [subsurface metagenome]
MSLDPTPLPELLYLVGYLQDEGIGTVTVAGPQDLIARLRILKSGHKDHQGLGGAGVAHGGKQRVLHLLGLEFQRLGNLPMPSSF